MGRMSAAGFNNEHCKGATGAIEDDPERTKLRCRLRYTIGLGYYWPFKSNRKRDPVSLPGHRETWIIRPSIYRASVL